MMSHGEKSVLNKFVIVGDRPTVIQLAYLRGSLLLQLAVKLEVGDAGRFEGTHDDASGMIPPKGTGQG